MYKFIPLILIAIFSSNVTIASDYPKTRDERIADEMGSVLGKDGFTFRPQKIKNESTATNSSKNNQYLWQASLEIIDFAPLAIENQETGTISTNWFTSKKSPNVSSKVTVKILDNVIATESLEVKYQSRKLVNGIWQEAGDKTEEANGLEREIIRRARDIYQKAKN